jgi:signal transduction histidine kinase
MKFLKKPKSPIPLRAIPLIPYFILFLLSVHRSEAQDTAAVNRLNRSSEINQDRNTDSALFFAGEALKAADKIKYAEGKIIALNNIGWINYRKGNYKKASEFAFEALNAAEKIGNYNEAAKANNTIGSVYNDQSVPVNSLLYFNRALHQYKRAGNKAGEGRIWNNLGYTALKANMLDSALYYCNEAIKINSTLPNKYYLAFTYRTLGDIYKTKREFTDAYTYFRKSLVISNSIQNNFLAVTNLNRLGQLEQEMNKTDSAIHYYSESNKLAVKSGFRSILPQSLEGLAKAYALKKNYSAAYTYQKAFSDLNDSLKNAANTETIAILQSNYESEKKEVEINLLKKDKDLQKIKLAEQTQFITTLIILTLMIFFFSIFLFRRYSYEKKYNKKINEQSAQLTAINTELKETVALRDKVLSILSHDLRSPLSSLSATMMLLDNEALSPEEFSIIKEKLARQLSSLNMTLDNILNWALTQVKKDMKPKSKQIDVAGILKESADLTESTAGKKGITFNLNLSSDSIAFADPDQINIVCRNLLSNAVKFSFENEAIQVQTTTENNLLKVSVTNRGASIPIQEQSKIFNHHLHYSTYGTMNEKGTGIGLILCKEFVEMNKGQINFESVGDRTTFHFSLPKFEA